jgi:DNA invertase Pin-like site-specific DNA recombinase
MKIGYVRVSTKEQNTLHQEVLMQELGVDMIFVDKTSEKNMDRPEFKKHFDYVREGDTVIVESISRFARKTKELLNMVSLLTENRLNS